MTSPHSDPLSDDRLDSLIAQALRDRADDVASDALTATAMTDRIGLRLPPGQPGSYQLRTALVLAVVALLVVGSAVGLAVGAFMRLVGPDAELLPPDDGPAVCRNGDIAGLTIGTHTWQGSAALMHLGLSVRPDGSILLGRVRSGRLELTQLHTDGTPDEGFAPHGRRSVETGWTGRFAAAAVAGDCSIAVVTTENDPATAYAVTRYRPDGDIDAAFGDEGTVDGRLGELPGEAYAAVAIQPDGKVLVVGTTGGIGPEASDGWGTTMVRESVKFAAARLNPDGSPDLTFGEGGVKQQGLSSGMDPAAGALIRQDGRIVLVGSTGQMTAGGEDNDIGIVRWNADGSLDSSFDGGVVELHAPNSDANSGVAIAQDALGRTLVLGRLVLYSTLSRVGPTGELDLTFGDAGFLRDLSLIGGLAVAVQDDGKIILASNHSVIRLNADGSPDLTFGDGGRVELAE